MAIPTSVKLALDRIEKNINSIQRREGSNDEYRVEVGEQINNLTLALDKLMNHVFSIAGSKEGGKPNVYFPMYGSKDRLDSRLNQMKMGSLATDYPEVYAAIVDVQPFGPSSPQWWQQLHQISLKRHEDHPEINEEKTNGVRIGSPGNQIFIKDMRIDGRKAEINISGYERTHSGLVRPIRVEAYMDTVERLESTDQDPLEFLSHCLKESRALAKRVSDSI